MILPESLSPRDKIALIAPCSPVDPAQIEPAADFIGELGYTPVIYSSCYARKHYLAGDDLTRAKDINDAFADPEIKAMIAMRGGYGGARLDKYLDCDMIRENPKIFCGYSDVTVLHAILHQRCGLVTFHTPMPGIAEAREDSRSRDCLAAVLRGDFPRELTAFGEPLRVLCEGRAEGILTGGNLTVIASTVGTPYQLETEGKILFLEDVGERAYAIDRALLHLRDGGLLQTCAGILLGTWRDCTPPDGATFDELFREWFAPLGVPVISGLPCGHSVPSLSLPLGCRVLIDGGAVSVFAGAGR